MENNEINEKIKFDKNSILTFLIIFMGLVVIFSYGTGNVSATSNVVYVNGSHGNNAWSGTSWATAKKSIKNAVGTVSNNGAIYIASGTYKEHGIDIKKNITISGLNQQKTIINAQEQDKIFYMDSSATKITLKYLTLTNGSGGGGYGGAIENEGTLTINSCTFSNNWVVAQYGYYMDTDGQGGAIYNNGYLKVTNSVFTNNHALNSIADSYGGAIDNDGTATAIINGCTFTSNIAEFGAALENYDGTMSVTSSTFINNHATSFNAEFINPSGYGGAIANSGGRKLTVTNSIFTGNKATGNDGDGGAVYNWGNGNLISLHSNQFIGDTANKGKEIYNSMDYTTPGTIDAKYNWWGSNNNPTSNVYGGVNISPWELYVNPKITSVSPKNGATSVSRTSTIYVQFNELIKSDTNWSKIYVKDKYGHAVSISKSISGNTLNITTPKKLSNSYYTVYIPRAAIKDYAGNHFASAYTFKFKTGN